MSPLISPPAGAVTVVPADKLVCILMIRRFAANFNHLRPFCESPLSPKRLQDVLLTHASVAFAQQRVDAPQRKPENSFIASYERCVIASWHWSTPIV